MLYAAFPDLHHEIEQQIGEGNKVAYNYGRELKRFRGYTYTTSSLSLCMFGMWSFAGILFSHL